MASNLKVDIVRPTATNGNLSLKGDSGGSATTNGVTVNSSGNTAITGTTTISSLVATTADINGGTIDGTTIATSDITVGSGKTLNVSAGTLTLANDQISGDAIHSGTISNFASTGIDDNASTTTLTIDSSGNVGIGRDSPKAQQHVFGLGQTTAALTDAGNRGGMLRVSDNNNAAGSGGAIIFANSQGDTANSVGFAAIKGLLADGSNNTNGHLAFSTRTNTTDTALTERMRIDSSGDVTIQGSLGVDSITDKAGTDAPNFPNGVTLNSSTTLDGVASTSEINGTHTTGSVSSGSTSLTVASGTGVSNGDYIVGEGITPGTTVSSGGGTTSITMSANANATLASDPVSFYPATKVLTAGNVAGMLCRAWVNFKGTGTVAIRASSNVSSITDNGTGDYTVNFTNAMPDSNYGMTIVGQRSDGSGVYNGTNGIYAGAAYTPTASAIRVTTSGTAGTNAIDYIAVSVNIFR